MSVAGFTCSCRGGDGVAFVLTGDVLVCAPVCFLFCCRYLARLFLNHTYEKNSF